MSDSTTETALKPPHTRVQKNLKAIAKIITSLRNKSDTTLLCEYLQKIQGSLKTVEEILMVKIGKKGSVICFKDNNDIIDAANQITRNRIFINKILSQVPPTCNISKRLSKLEQLSKSLLLAAIESQFLLIFIARIVVEKRLDGESIFKSYEKMMTIILEQCYLTKKVNHSEATVEKTKQYLEIQRFHDIIKEPMGVDHVVEHILQYICGSEKTDKNLDDVQSDRDFQVTIPNYEQGLSPFIKPYLMGFCKQYAAYCRCATTELISISMNCVDEKLFTVPQKYETFIMRYPANSTWALLKALLSTLMSFHKDYSIDNLQININTFASSDLSLEQTIAHALSLTIEIIDNGAHDFLCKLLLRDANLGMFRKNLIDPFWDLFMPKLFNAYIEIGHDTCDIYLCFYTKECQNLMLPNLCGDPCLQQAKYILDSFPKLEERKRKDCPFLENIYQIIKHDNSIKRYLIDNLKILYVMIMFLASYKLKDLSLLTEEIRPVFFAAKDIAKLKASLEWACVFMLKEQLLYGKTKSKTHYAWSFYASIFSLLGLELDCDKLKLAIDSFDFFNDSYAKVICSFLLPGNFIVDCAQFLQDKKKEFKKNIIDEMIFIEKEISNQKASLSPAALQHWLRRKQEYFGYTQILYQLDPYRFATVFEYYCREEHHEIYASYMPNPRIKEQLEGKVVDLLRSRFPRNAKLKKMLNDSMLTPINTAFAFFIRRSNHSSFKGGVFCEINPNSKKLHRYLLWLHSSMDGRKVISELGRQVEKHLLNYRS